MSASETARVIRVHFKTPDDHGWWHFPSLAAWEPVSKALRNRPDIHITDIQDWPMMDVTSALASLERDQEEDDE